MSLAVSYTMIIIYNRNRMAANGMATNGMATNGIANQMVQRVYTCKARKYDTCANEFARSAQFDIVETLDDGNCFFDTLSKAGMVHHIPRLSFTHTQLRQRLVEYMHRHMNEIMPYFIVNNNANNNADPTHRINQLGEDGVWNNNDGDIVSQVAADAFHINMNIYDVKKQRGAFFINKIQFYKRAYSHMIDILRINDGHYELLVSEHMNSSPNNKQSSASANATANANANAEFAKKLQEQYNKESRSHKNNTRKNSKNKSPRSSLMNALNAVKNDTVVSKSRIFTVDVLKTLLEKLGVSDKEMKGKLKSDLIKMYRERRKSSKNMSNLEMALAASMLDK